MADSAKFDRRSWMTGQYKIATVCLAAGVLLAGLAGCSSKEAELISQMEASLRLPNGAHALDSYVRYYAIEGAGERREVRGVLVKRKNQTGVHLVKANALPVLFDGGCGVVNVRYSPREKKFLQVACNGDA
jgi:hypothetical protein